MSRAGVPQSAIDAVGLASSVGSQAALTHLDLAVPVGSATALIGCAEATSRRAPWGARPGPGALRAAPRTGTTAEMQTH